MTQTDPPGQAIRNARRQQTPVVASNAVVRPSPGEWEFLGEFQFKGIAAPITVHALIDDTTQNNETGNDISAQDASGNNGKTNA